MSQSLTARKDQFAWSEPGQYRFQIAKVARCQLELSRREVRSRDANRITHLSQCAEEVVPCPVEQIVGKRRARSDGLDHFPSDKPLGELRIFRLLADRHPKSLLNQSTQVLSGGFHRDAGQGDLAGTTVVPRGQRQAECPRRDLCVFVEHLVEVTHPEEQNRVLMTRLDLPVLL